MKFTYKEPNGVFRNKQRISRSKLCLTICSKGPAANHHPEDAKNDTRPKDFVYCWNSNSAGVLANNI